MTILQILYKDGMISYVVKGKSMEPMLYQNRDIVTICIKNPNSRCKENDVVLYKRNDKLVLHRIVRVCPEGEYIILGDNCQAYEYDITDRDIIGILSSFNRNGHHYDITDPVYIGYIKRLRKKEKIRVFFKKLKSYIQHNQSYFFFFFYKMIVNIFRKIDKKILKFVPNERL